jgi:hypothetical protein
MDFTDDECDVLTVTARTVISPAWLRPPELA